MPSKHRLLITTGWLWDTPFGTTPHRKEFPGPETISPAKNAVPGNFCRWIDRLRARGEDTSRHAHWCGPYAFLFNIL
jgi:hypothetical protein